MIQPSKLVARFKHHQLLTSTFGRKFRMRMKRRFCCCLVVLFLQSLSWVSATSRSFSSHDDTQQPGSLSSATLVSNTERLPDSMLKRGVSKSSEEGYDKELSRIGSSPPSCEHKCYGCTPCEAIQVPTTSRPSHWGVQYANYEPEGWKCQCGTSLYTP